MTWSLSNAKMVKTEFAILNCDPQLNSKNSSFYRLVEHSTTNEELFLKLFNTFNYLNATDFNLLIKHDPKYYESLKNLKKTIILFKHIKISFISTVDQQVISPLFMFIKKNYNLIRATASEDCIFEFGSNLNYAEEFCQPIIQCLDFIKRLYMMILFETSGDYSLCEFILKQMKQLLLFVGRISQFESKFQEFSFNRPSDSESCLYHHFHLTLQIWWTFVEICYVTQSSKNQIVFDADSLLLVGDNTSDLFLQSVRILFYDLFVYSVGRFNQNQQENEESPQTSASPFICTCFIEIITMLKILITNQSSKTVDDEENIDLERFNSILFDIVALFDPSNCDKISFAPKNEIQIDHFKFVPIEKCIVFDFNQFILWLWPNIVPLMRISLDDSGGFIDDSNLNLQIPPYIIKIYRKIFKEIEMQCPHSKPSPLQGKSRLVPHMLIANIRLTRFLTETPIDLMLLFMDFHLKRLNHNFNINSGFNLMEDCFLTIKNGQKWSELMLDIIDLSTINTNHIHDCFKLFIFYIHLQLSCFEKKSLLSKAKLAAKSNFITKIERQTLTLYQKIISKVIVTLQPNLVRTLQPNGFIRMTLFHLILIRSTPKNLWLEFSDKLLNPIRELIKEKKSVNFLEMIIKFLFSIFHVLKQPCDALEKIATIIQKLINNIISDNIKLINPRKDFLSIIIGYFQELSLLIDKNRKISNNETIDANRRPGIFLLFYFEDLIHNLELLSLFKRLHCLNTHPSDRLPVFEFLNELLNLLHAEILGSHGRKHIQSVSFSQITTTTNSTTILMDPNNSSEGTSDGPCFDIEQLINKSMPSFMDSITEVIKLEIDNNNNDESIASLALNATLINVILTRPNLTLSIEDSQRFQGLETIDSFLSCSDRTNRNFQNNSHEMFQLNYLYLLFQDNMILNSLQGNPNNGINSRFISTWLRLLIAINSETIDEGQKNTEYEKLISVSRNVFSWIIAIDDRYHQINQSINVESSTGNSDEAKIPHVIYEKFLKKLSAQFQSLVDLDQRMNHVNMVDKYFRPMITTCYQMLANRKWNLNNHREIFLIGKMFRNVALLVHHLYSQLYIVGKSDCLMVTLIENIILIPLNTTSSNILASKSVWPSLFRISFPMIFEGLCKLDHQNDPYIERKIRQVILLYLPYLANYLNYVSIKTVLSNQNENIYDCWKSYIYRIIERNYLSPREPPISKELFDYLNQFCRNEFNKDELRRLSMLIFQMNLTDFVTSDRDYRTMLFQTIVSCSIQGIGSDFNEAKSFVEQVLLPFVKMNLQNKPAKFFEVIKFLFPCHAHRTCPIFFHEFCSGINQHLDYIESVSFGGTSFIIRKLLKEFITHYEKLTPQNDFA